MEHQTTLNHFGIWGVQAHDRTGCNRLTWSGFTNDCQRFALVEVEANITDGLNRSGISIEING